MGNIDFTRIFHFRNELDPLYQAFWQLVVLFENDAVGAVEPLANLFRVPILIPLRIVFQRDPEFGMCVGEKVIHCGNERFACHRFVRNEIQPAGNRQTSRQRVVQFDYEMVIQSSAAPCSNRLISLFLVGFIAYRGSCPDCTFFSTKPAFSSSTMARSTSCKRRSVHSSKSHHWAMPCSVSLASLWVNRYRSMSRASSRSLFSSHSDKRLSVHRSSYAKQVPSRGATATR